MPSDALVTWRSERTPRLQDVEDDCLHLATLHAADPDRVQEYVRAYAVLLCSEFQGFCRDLHTECADRLVDSVSPAPLRTVLRVQCFYGRKLDTANPNAGNLGADFNRYGLVSGPRSWQRTPATRPDNIGSACSTPGGTPSRTTITTRPTSAGR